MSISAYPSKLTLPSVNPGFNKVLEYLIDKFPAINAELWYKRSKDGKIHWHDGSLIDPETPYRAQQRVYYYREVEKEPSIPFEEKIIFQDEELIIAYKPHFLPVTPGGRYVNECLQNRLRDKTGMSKLQALHRLDRATAGLVMLSVNPTTRHLYHQLFETRQVQKRYQAIARTDSLTLMPGQRWVIKNRLVKKSTPSFLMKVTEGMANSESIIRCLKKSNGLALFDLLPVTGKTHQLRLHMQTLGWPILNDGYYPVLTPKSPDNYALPLQLLAKELCFTDPLTKIRRLFSCSDNLKFE